MGFGLPGLVIVPGELAGKWRGRGGDRVRLTFQYWQKIVKKLPDELRPKHGHKDTPHMTVDSQAAANAVVDKLLAFVMTQHPSVAIKKKKQKELMRFLSDDGEIDYRLVIDPESEGDVAHDTLEAEEADAMRWKVGDGEGLVWGLVGREVSARASADEVVFVNAADPEAVKIGKGTAHGTFRFEKTLVGLWFSVAVTDLKVVDLSEVNTVVKAKKSDDGGAITLPARGTYRAETGGKDLGRWLRFVRA